MNLQRSAIRCLLRVTLNKSLCFAIVTFSVWIAAIDTVVQANQVLVLDNSDSDYKNPPFQDRLFLLSANGEVVKEYGQFNICQTIGGHRALTVAPDGSWFVVSENVRNRLVAYQTQTGKELWSLDGTYDATAISRSGQVYALRGDGTIKGKETVVIASDGSIRSQASIGGYEIVIDDYRENLWIIGTQITQCDLSLSPRHVNTSIQWCGVSAEIARDGSLWVAERDRSNKDRLLHLSPNGETLKAIPLDFSPRCVRVNPATGHVWVTGRRVRAPITKRGLNKLEGKTGPLPLPQWLRDSLVNSVVSGRTATYDQTGQLIESIDVGGHSLSMDSSTGSIWLAAREMIIHFSPDGEKSSRYTKVSGDQKYLATLPTNER